jgi:hypothetical protein
VAAQEHRAARLALPTLPVGIIDCGEADPVVLEFDHLEAKEFNVSHGVRHLTWESVLAEIAKCDGGFVRALLTTPSATRAGDRT